MYLFYYYKELSRGCLIFTAKIEYYHYQRTQGPKLPLYLTKLVVLKALSVCKNMLTYFFIIINKFMYKTLIVQAVSLVPEKQNTKQAPSPQISPKAGDICKLNNKHIYIA